MVIEMNNKKSESLRAIARYLPREISSPLLNLKEGDVTDLCEIRIKASHPVLLIFTEKQSFITSGGRLTEIYSNDLVRTDLDCVKMIFARMCKFSVYSLTDNIRNGFITLENGCRVGVYGAAVTADGKINSVRNISGMNIRISGSFDGVGRQVASLYENKKVNTLICGPPLSGKTTVLRDLCKILSDDLKYKVSVVDERGEFYGYYVGYNTDVLSGYPKASGIQIAVRTLSPDIVVCDELGEISEIEAILDGLNSGVSFITAIHCNSKMELQKKEQYRLLNNSFSLDYCVFLKGKSEVEEICNAKELADANARIVDCGNINCACGSIHSLYV